MPAQTSAAVIGFGVTPRPRAGRGGEPKSAIDSKRRRLWCHSPCRVSGHGEKSMVRNDEAESNRRLWPQRARSAGVTTWDLSEEGLCPRCKELVDIARRNMEGAAKSKREAAKAKAEMRHLWRFDGAGAWTPGREVGFLLQQRHRLPVVLRLRENSQVR